MHNSQRNGRLLRDDEVLQAYFEDFSSGEDADADADAECRFFAISTDDGSSTRSHKTADLKAEQVLHIYCAQAQVVRCCLSKGFCVVLHMQSMPLQTASASDSAQQE